MADPLSIASRTAGLISLGIEVSKLLFKFYNEYKDQEPPRFDPNILYDQDGLVDICLGLIDIAPTEDEDGQTSFTVHIAHFSVQEYLLSDRTPKNKLETFAIQSELANAEITKICLVYLLQPALSDGPVDEPKDIKFPFARFAAKYWFKHYSVSTEDNGVIEKLISKLFNETKAFVTWIQLHDMDDGVGLRRGSITSILDMSAPLYYAALLGLEFTLNSILIAITDDDSLDTVNAQSGTYGNALQAAAYRGHEKIVQMLLNHGAEVNAQGGYYGNALQAAACRGHEKVLQMLLDRGAEVNIQGGHYGNALQAAACRGHEKVLQMLLDRGAEVNAQGGYYGNALQAAAYKGHEKMVQMLLAKEVNLDARDSTYERTPLSLASVQGHDAIVKLLLSTGEVSVNAKCHCGRTPLIFAAQYGHEAIAESILNVDSIVPDQKDHYGSTPLSMAVRHSHVEVVKLLLATKVVNCNSHDFFGRSVFWWAKRNGNVAIQEMLADYCKTQGMPMCYDEFVDVQPNPFDPTSRYCDICTWSIPSKDAYYHCGLCNGGDFDICMECYELKGHCLEDSHELVQSEE